MRRLVGRVAAGPTPPPTSAPTPPVVSCPLPGSQHAGALVRTPCIDGGCNQAAGANGNRYIDFCSATFADNGTSASAQYSCCGCLTGLTLSTFGFGHPCETRAGVELEVSTAEVGSSTTTEQVFTQFYVDQQWSGKELFFEGADRGETHRKIFASATGATKLRLSISGTNAWGFWQIKLGGVTIREHPNGKSGIPYQADGAGFWIDQSGTESQTGQSAPSSIDIDIPQSKLCFFSMRLCQSV